MSNIEPFAQNAQTLLLTEKNIQDLQERLRVLRQDKQTLQDKLTREMIDREWQQRKVAIGQYHMCFAERKQYNSLTFSYLEEMLPKLIPDKDQVDYLIKYLKDQRTVKSVQEVRFVPKRLDDKR